MNPMDRMKEAGMKQAVKQIDVREHPLVRSIASIIAQLEHSQAQALARGIQAGELDVGITHDVEDRAEQLLDTAEAIRDQDLAGYWFESVVEIDRPELAQDYVDLEGDEWREQLEKWYSKYYEMGVVDVPLEGADRADIGHVAAMHVGKMFDVSLREFVVGVINWDREKAIRRLLAGNIEEHTQIIHLLAEELEERQRRIEDLEERLDDD